jgi:hypothetical protein
MNDLKATKMLYSKPECEVYEIEAEATFLSTSGRSETEGVDNIIIDERD